MISATELESRQEQEQEQEQIRQEQQQRDYEGQQEQMEEEEQKRRVDGSELSLAPAKGGEAAQGADSDRADRTAFRRVSPRSSPELSVRLAQNNRQGKLSAAGSGEHAVAK